MEGKKTREEVLERLKAIVAPELEPLSVHDDRAIRAVISYLEGLADQPETVGFWGYGIVDKDGRPWFSEGCVSPQAIDLAAELAALNDAIYDEQRPYRIARLLVER